MQNETVQSKETDITGVLVVTLVVMLGILFVTMSNKFMKTSTSTSTKAAGLKKTLKDYADKYKSTAQNGMYDWTAFCVEKLKALNPNIYTSASPYVTFKTGLFASCDNPSLNTKYFHGRPSLVKDQIDSVACCAPTSNLYSENDKYCTTMNKGIISRCKQTGCGGSYGLTGSSSFTVAVGGKCDYVDKGVTEKSNDCCIQPLPTKAP